MKDLVPIRSAVRPPFNKAHSAVYALMAYRQLTARYEREGDLMGLTQAQIDERKAKEAAEAAEKKVDEAKATDTEAEKDAE